MSIKCGYCKERHPSIDQVRACASKDAGTVLAPPAPQPYPGAQVGQALASEKQVRFIEKLLAERPSLEGTITNPAALTKRAASLVIDNLLKQPKENKTSHRPTAEPVAETIEDGFYVSTDGAKVFKVQVAVHGNGKLYAKEMDTDTTGFNYVPGLITKVRAGVADGTIEKLTLERAKELGKLYGICCRCARTLTNEDSIEAGIGPICAGKGF